ncbi:MAG TPA: 2-succinyl-5-enolpyruvyl-6-hydroxy-3-cyclohexene-1-carboxylic-acid synthase [Opitutus sp.]|nr:2-succinyl-5-enolpyruvyl-6-hydroxy-3-cyclohexene-1-carboxylic-acid synthase [Opitutus sp.]
MSGAAEEFDFRNANTLWGSVLVGTLARCGVRCAVVSPGSRSTPITMALARCAGLEAVPVLDERSAAFFALGQAKRTGRPVVLVCTSGTAGANYLPAVIEAQESGVPLLVITADRPPEMRACASGQTIDQQKLYGSHVNFFHELAVPDASGKMLAYLRQAVAHAVERTIRPERGPVHLNAPFRDPLAPVQNDDARGVVGAMGKDFFAHLREATPAGPRMARWRRPRTTRGVIVAGPAAPENPTHYVKMVRGLGRKLGWPVLADGLSQVRGGGGVVTTYDAILRDEAAARALQPEFVLCLGGWPTSKVLRGWIEAAAPEILLVAETAANRDALHGRTRQIVASVETFSVTGRATAGRGYLEQWRRAETAARAAIDRALEAEKGWFEGKASWLLAKHLPKATPVSVASSMPVRDVEYFWPANGRGQVFYFNRGANGIDGTLATALGVAHGADAPAVLLTGDLALLHDTNGFLLRPKLRGSLTIVLINNRGGGIFEHLPIAKFEPPFEEYFATPQEVNFARLSAAHGVEHVVVKDWAQFTELVSVLPANGVRVLELRTDRKRDAAIRRALFAAAAREAAKL